MIQRQIKIPLTKSLFLFGARQTGKSTLLQSLFTEGNSFYYDLLKSEEFTRLAAHPEIFREEVSSRSSKITHVIIDEVQRIPALLNEVQYLMESSAAPYFALSGSSARKLKRSKANLLAGRALNYKLYPLMSSEIGRSFSLTRALQRGTLPSIYLEESDSIAQDMLRAYVDVYLKEEIELEAQLRNIGSFLHFLNIAANENGRVINFSNIARETGVSYQTVKSYFQILEDTLVGNFLFPYQRSLRKRLVQHPKFYFFDTGVVRALSKKISVPLEPKTPDYGRIFEHFIILEIMRAAEYNKLDYSFSYYRTESGAEVDLIIETPKGQILAIEVKATNIIESPHIRGLISFKESCPEAILYCVCLAPHRRIVDKVTIIPWQEMIKELK
ncbi:MAG: putative ATPase [Candidatus Saganbacteria bacterium]|uniref:Putative ATPase n=1 Tax=Candidatus Saganbacteria bacterium TaxID=2575572 RepID=A0A833L1S3_UNCSA|nr:MAG: putative ATPase [Candidatus Saganbacteria bacterium]